MRKLFFRSGHGRHHVHDLQNGEDDSRHLSAVNQSRMSHTGHRKYLGVGSRNGKYYCSMRILEKSDVKFFATYDTEEEAARACDVVTFYTNRVPSHYNFPDSVSLIEFTCKRRPQEYDELIIQDPVRYTRLIRSFMVSQAENLMRNLFPAKPSKKRTRHLPNGNNCQVRIRIGLSERMCRDRPDHPHAESVQNAIEVPCNQHESNNSGRGAPLSCYSLYCVSKKIASILQTLPSCNRLMWLNNVVTPFLQEKGGDSLQSMCNHDILEEIRASHPGDQRNHMGDENLGTARAGPSSDIVADSEGLLCEVLKLVSSIMLHPKILMRLILGHAFMFSVYILLSDVVGVGVIVTSQEKATLPTSPKKTNCALEHFPVEDVAERQGTLIAHISGSQTSLESKIYEEVRAFISSIRCGSAGAQWQAAMALSKLSQVQEIKSYIAAHAIPALIDHLKDTTSLAQDDYIAMILWNIAIVCNKDATKHQCKTSDVLAAWVEQVCTNNSPGASTCEKYEQALPDIASNPSAGSLGPVIFHVDEGLLQWECFDTTARRWRKMPPLSCLPAPDPKFWRADFFVAGGGGLFCVNVGKPPGLEEIFVCNPFTQEIRKLPPLIYRRHPMLIHILVDKTSNTYKIIAAGSCMRVCGTESLSLKTEVYDSRHGTWIVAGDVPGPSFSIHDYQTGEYVRSKGVLLCTGISYEGRGILAYNVMKGEWISTWSRSLPSYPDSKHQQGRYVIAQLMKFDDEVFLFTEQDSQDEEVTHGGEVIHSREVIRCIHRLDILEIVDPYEIFDRSETFWADWKTVMKQSKGIRRWYPEYPEYVCVPHGKDEFAIFNNFEHTGVVYNICLDSEQPLPPATVMSGQYIYITNPITSTLEPNCNILP